MRTRLQPSRSPVAIAQTPVRQTPVRTRENKIGLSPKVFKTDGRKTSFARRLKSFLRLSVDTLRRLPIICGSLNGANASEWSSRVALATLDGIVL